MALQFGLGAYIGFGKESSYGTSVSRTVFRPLISANAARKRTKAPRRHMLGAKSGVNARNLFRGPEEVSVEFEIEAHYRGIGLLLEHILGSSSSSGAGPYTHTYPLGRAMGTGLTVELGRGADESGAGYREVFAGTRISRLELNAGLDQVASLRAQGIARSAPARDAAITPTLGTDDPIVPWSDAGSLSWGGLTLSLLSARLVIERNLIRRQRFGSAYTAQPAMDKMVDVRLEFEVELEDNTVYTKFHDYTTGDATLTFSSAVSGSNSAMTVTVQNAELSEVNDGNISAQGPLKLSGVLTGLSDGTDEGLSIAITNDDSSAIAA